MDYVATKGVVGFKVRETVKHFELAVCTDTVNEGTQKFVVKLVSASGVTVADGSATVTITDDDPLPTLSFDSPSVPEGNSETKTLSFTATLSAASEQSLKLYFGAAFFAPAPDRANMGAACAGNSDFIRPEAIYLSPGTTTRSVNVLVCGDTITESNEGVDLAPGLATADTAGYPVSQLSTAGVIVNDD